MSDVLLQIGIDVSEAKRGHDQIIAYNTDIAASFAKVTQQQSASTAKIVQDEQKKADATVKSARERISVEERAAAAIMAGYVRQGHAMGAMGNAANQTGQQFSNMRGIIGQAGLQISDLAIVSQMGAQSIGQMGIQVGQFLGVLGPMGAIAGAAVTILGVLAGTYVNLGDETEKAKEAQDKYNDAIGAGWKAVDRYLVALDKLDGRTPTWRKEQEDISNVKEEIRLLEEQRDKLFKTKKESFGLILPGPDEFRENEFALMRARNALSQLQRRPGETVELEKQIKERDAAAELAKTLADLNDTRNDGIKISELEASGREKAAAMLKAEADVRSRLAGASKEIIDAEVKYQRESAGQIFDLNQKKQQSEKSAREAEAERKRQMSEMTRETVRIAEAQDKARGSVDEYVTSINRQREALGMSERDAAIYRAGLEASDKLTKAGIQNVEELAAAQERAGKAAAALYDEQQARGKVLSKDQIRGMAAQFSPDVAYQLQVQNVQKYREQLIELGVTEEQIAYAIEEANLRKLESSREWTDGATAALMRYSRDASNYSSMASRFVTSSLNSMENALVGLTTGTETAASAFKKMAASIIQDLISMQVRASITGPLSGMLSGVVSSGFGNIGTAFQYGTNIGSEQTAMLAAQNAGFNAYASGTDYAQSGLAIVGEEGPELMQLGGGERIYPAGETAAILSGKAANSNMAGGGSLSIAEGAIVVNAPGASAEDAAIIAQQVATAVVQQAAPQIVKASVQQSLSASKSAADRGGSYAQAMGRR